jgi:FeS assembly SUF system protein
MNDDDIKRDHSQPTQGEHAHAPHGRDVVDMGHRPHLQANAALAARPEAPAFEQPVAHAKPPSLAEGGTPVEGSTLSEEELDRLSGDIIMALKTVHDPEIPADIYELGLIYKIDVDNDRNVDVQMTLTAPGCPVAGEMPIWVKNAVEGVEGVKGCEVELVFDPPWDQSRMSDEAKLAVGMF